MLIVTNPYIVDKVRDLIVFCPGAKGIEFQHGIAFLIDPGVNISEEAMISFISDYLKDETESYRLEKFVGFTLKFLPTQKEQVMTKLQTFNFDIVIEYVKISKHAVLFVNQDDIDTTEFLLKCALPDVGIKRYD